MTNALTRRDPFGSLFDEFFTDFFARGGVPALRGGELPSTVRARMDVIDRNDRFEVLVDLPGVKKDDIQVSIDGAQVTLTAEVKREKETREGERVLHSERAYGKVTRSFTLPQELDEAKAEAKFRDGVLELTLPKKAAAARKAITIQ